MERLIAECGSQGLLDAAFELFRQELTLADADYAAALDLEAQTLEEFCDAYFENRAQADPFNWARRNLEEASQNAERHFTVKWRYAILRMHEVFGVLAPHDRSAHPRAAMFASATLRSLAAPRLYRGCRYWVFLAARSAGHGPHLRRRGSARRLLG